MTNTLQKRPSLLYIYYQDDAWRINRLGAAESRSRRSRFTDAAQCSALSLLYMFAWHILKHWIQSRTFCGAR